jgi:hypothetical protein
MNATHTSFHPTFSGRRLLAAALLLGATVVGTPLLAAENGPVTTNARTVAATRGSEALEVSSSRINGRIDWDVDYPSQLAPQPVHAATPTDNLAVSATAGCAHAGNCVLKAVQP